MRSNPTSQALDQEMASAAARHLLDQFRSLHPTAFAAFGSWPEVADALAQHRRDQAAKDAILLPLLAAYGRREHPLLGTILVGLYWRHLCRFADLKQRWDADAEELSQNIVLMFLEACQRIDLTKRRQRLDEKMQNDCIHHLHDLYERRWRDEQVIQVVDHSTLVNTETDADEDRRAEALDQRIVLEQGLAALHRHRDAGTVSDIGCQLLIGTRLLGRRLADMASDLGMSFQCAKKRRQRAEAAIRKANADPTTN